MAGDESGWDGDVSGEADDGAPVGEAALGAAEIDVAGVEEEGAGAVETGMAGTVGEAAGAVEAETAGGGAIGVGSTGTGVTELVATGSTDPPCTTGVSGRNSSPGGSGVGAMAFSVSWTVRLVSSIVAISALEAELRPT